MEPKSTKISFVDSHAHLDFEQFVQDRDAVIKNAHFANISAVINIGINLETSKKSIELAETYDFIYATAGIHPHDAGDMKLDQWQELVQLFNHPKVVAIGEIGLDYYRDYSPHEVQKEVLFRQLDLAVEYKVLDSGYFISFTGVVTFKNANALKILADYVPLERLLLETDCPFMAPVPFRGKRCEPAHVPYIAKKIAEAKNLDVAELALQTNQNVEKLFGVKIQDN